MSIHPRNLTTVLLVAGIILAMLAGFMSQGAHFGWLVPPYELIPFILLYILLRLSPAQPPRGDTDREVNRLLSLVWTFAAFIAATLFAMALTPMDKAPEAIGRLCGHTIIGTGDFLFFLTLRAVLAGRKTTDARARDALSVVILDAAAAAFCLAGFILASAIFYIHFMVMDWPPESKSYLWQQAKHFAGIFYDGFPEDIRDAFDAKGTFMLPLPFITAVLAWMSLGLAKRLAPPTRWDRKRQVSLSLSLYLLFLGLVATLLSITSLGRFSEEIPLHQMYPLLTVMLFSLVAAMAARRAVLAYPPLFSTLGFPFRPPLPYPFGPFLTRLVLLALIIWGLAGFFA